MTRLTYLSESLGFDLPLFELSPYDFWLIPLDTLHWLFIFV